MKREPKTPSESSPSSVLPTAMRTMPDGGQLRIGNPGNKGGTGRPPSELRAAFREALDDGPGELKRIISAPGSRDADRIAAILACAKIGVPLQVETLPTPRLTPEERTTRLARLITKKPRPA